MEKMIEEDISNIEVPLSNKLVNKDFMLIIESIEKEKDIEIPPGSYMLNSELNGCTSICEYVGGVSKYEGIIKISEKTPLQVFRYELEPSLEDEKILLPSEKFKNLWIGLIYDEKFKYMFLNHLIKCCDPESNELMNLMGVNKTVLCYGEPGIGKSTLMKALAQKLAIRKKKKLEFKEVNCKSILSKFYGESLQILSSLFSDSNDGTIFLFDDVDSILLNRRNLLNKNEPVDSMRIVNLFLNVIDQKKYIFLFTSNMKDELDQAFLDRCDIVEEMKMLTPEGVYKLLVVTLSKMMDLGALKYHSFMDYKEIVEFRELSDPVSFFMFQLVNRIVGTSSRRIKKIIYAAYDKDISIIELLERIGYISNCL